MQNNTNQMSRVKQSIITAVCIALCVVLPMVFHSIPQAGTIYCPMHIPILICGLVCNWQYSIICGIVGPIMSSIVTGMPNAVDLPAMMFELVAYGVICSILMKFIYTKKIYFDLYISLIVAMIFGRVCAGFVKAFIFARGAVTIKTLATAYFITCIPGVIVQLIIIPIIYIALSKSNLIPARYIIDDEIEED